MVSAAEPPRFRRDLVAARVEADGVQYVEVHDPDSGRSFRFYDFEHAVAVSFDGRSFDAIGTDLRERLGMELSSDQLAAFAAELDQLGFLASPLAPSAGASPAASGASAPAGGRAAAVEGAGGRAPPPASAGVVQPPAGAPAAAGIGATAGGAPASGGRATVPVTAPPAAGVKATPANAGVPGLGASAAVAAAGSESGAPAAAASGRPAAPAGGARVTPSAAVPTVELPPEPPPPFPLAVTPSPLTGEALASKRPGPAAQAPSEEPTARIGPPGGPVAGRGGARSPEARPLDAPRSASEPVRPLPPAALGQHGGPVAPGPAAVDAPPASSEARPAAGTLFGLGPSELAAIARVNAGPHEVPTGAPGGGDGAGEVHQPTGRPVLRIVASNAGGATPDDAAVRTAAPSSLPPPPIDRHQLGLDDADPPASARRSDGASRSGRRPRRARALVLAALLLVLAAAAAFGYLAFRVPVNPEPPPVAVKALTASPTAKYLFFSAPGTVSLAPGVTLAFATAGKVAEMAAPGARFEPGDILGLLETGKKIRAVFNHERERLVHHEQLLEAHRASGNKVEVRQAELKIQRKRQVVEAARTELAKVAIVPDQAGEVAEVLVNVGASIAPQTPALCTKGKALRAEIELPRDEATTLRQLGFCRVEVGGAPLDCTVSADDEAAETRVVLDLPGEAEVAPGAQALVARARYDAVFVVPPSAVVRTGGGDRLFVVNAQGRAEARPVSIIDRTTSEAVVAQGLDVGDQVIVDPPRDLLPDARVTVSP